MPEDQKTQLDMLKQQVESLQAEFYRGNFNASQDNNKFTRFTSRLRVPVYAVAPTVCEVGELYVNSGAGKLYVCSSANTWSLVGTQA
jgi:hypothetical protein